LLKQNQPFTLQMLLTHNAGFGNGNDSKSIVAQQYHRAGLFHKRNLEQSIATLSEMPLQSQPGQQWQRSLSYDVVARLVEVFSDQGLHQYLTQQVFTPLKMSNSHVLGYNNQLIVPSEKDEETANEDTEISNQIPPSSFVATIHFQSSVEDYLRFATLLLNGGQLDKTRLLGNKTVELMTTHQVDKAQVNGLPPGLNMGLGFFLLEDPAANMSYGNPGTYFWINDAGSMVWIDPQEQLIIVLALKEQSPNAEINKKITAVVYGALKE
jgi:CubicO group peptidase (beta-lactamase class C family)